MPCAMDKTSTLRPNGEREIARGWPQLRKTEPQSQATAQISRRASHAFGGSNRKTEYPAVAEDRLARSRQRKGLPESHLVRRQDRAIEIFLQRLDDSDGAKAVAADEDGLGAVWRLRTDPLIEFARLNRLLVGWQACGSGVNNLKTLALKIARALLVHPSREPGRADECKPCHAERDQCGDRRRAGMTTGMPRVRVSRRSLSLASSAAPRR